MIFRTEKNIYKIIISQLENKLIFKSASKLSSLKKMQLYW